ncbi:hypothetical protein PHMEG_00017465 [Phytophthora megakarya]|uniref:Uncharacterized protein n=1 Tax=Phytophthora megakarya TaxID=4795 RepID=A0A225VW87_9STRA|nr:hypothetical protein PHMEG_00017465 [Phytophthora megakarya]
MLSCTYKIKYVYYVTDYITSYHIRICHVLRNIDNRACWALLPHGYLLVRIVLPDSVIPELLKEAKARKYQCVLNNVGGGDDDFRLQSRVDENVISSTLHKLKNALQVGTAMVVPGWILTVFSFMRSNRGGKEKEAHQDYSDSALAKIRGINWTPDTVQDVLPPHGECQYCGKKMYNGPRLTALLLQEEPDGKEHRLKHKL